MVANSSAIRAMFEEGNRLAKIYGPENVFDFSLGNPNVPAPKAVKQAILDILDEEDELVLHGYTNSNAGYEDVRQAVAESLNERFGTAFAAKNITMTVGAAGGLNVILKALLNPGDEVLIPQPSYVSYLPCVTLADGVPVIIELEEKDQFKLTPEKLLEKITDKTKILVLPFPNNPTGAIMEKHELEEIAKTYPTPFYLYDEKGIRENAKALKEAFAWNKGFKEYFAVKATPNPTILKILKEEGCGTDCSSLTELMMSDKMGFKGDEIMFSSNDTPAEEFVLAKKLNATINLDDFTHIDFLEKTIGYIPETISCRYNPGGLFKISNDIMDNPGDAKYGMTTEQIFEAFKILKAKGAKNFGIHAFLASNTVTNEYYPMLAKVLFEVAVKLHEETGADIKFINLSGGIGIPYRPEQEPNDIFAIGEGVRKVYEEVLVPAGMGDVALYTELGRFMLAPYGCLVTKAIHEKHTHKEYIGVDACAVNLMRPAMYGAYHHITVLGKENAPCDHKYDITGSLCENNDKFAIDRMLPQIDMGDYLVIHDTGAHGFSMGYNYNGKLKSAELLLKEDGSVQMIRRAETPKDYFATFDFCDIMKKYL